VSPTTPILTGLDSLPLAAESLPWVTALYPKNPPIATKATTMSAMTMLRTVWLTRTGSLSGEPACCVAAVMFVPPLIG
jgi:hypothetical protein